MRRIAPICLILAACTSVLVSQYAYLNVQHPQKLNSYQGTIEEAKLAITPKGVYTQNDLYLTFSARGSSFQSADSVEVTLTFELPKDCIVNDLWLWIDDTLISKGLILDKWTATSIYENIVRRRRDPAVLTKEYSYSTTDQYKIKVYPLPGKGTRKVKISYLVPGKWTISSVSSFIPANIFRTSLYKPATVAVSYFPAMGWGMPRIAENSSLQFTPTQDSVLGAGYLCNIPSNMFLDYSSTLNLVVNSPMKGGVYAARYQNGDDGVYQLVLIPSQVLDVRSSKKVAFLFDYDSIKTTYDRLYIFNTLKTHLKSYYTASDSFNLILTLNGGIISRVSERWFPADSVGIAAAFDAALPLAMNTKTNLLELIKNGISYVKGLGGGGTLCLMTASDRYGDSQVANAALNEIKVLLPANISISVVDMLNRNYIYYYNGKYYYGNDYFYENLTKFARGIWISTRSFSGTSMLSAFTQYITPAIEAFDLYTTLQNGFCYARYTWGVGTSFSVNADAPVIQIGKSKGLYPLELNAVGFYNNVPIERTMSIPKSDIAAVDSFGAKVWTGKFISTLESLAPSNALTTQIIQISISNRVLSKYSAFLALEPNDSSRIVTQNPTGGGSPTLVEDNTEVATEDPIVQAFPNPFNSQTTLRLRLPKGVTSDQVSLRIFNTLGQLIRTLSTDGLSDKQVRTVAWNGKNEEGASVASGMYFFVFSSPKGIKSVKLVIIK